ncbi:MAG: hypothetical protein JW839_15760 [Candidatus Lokiarchaeota archaeon]|nr:hypothetical protein [Candidatus Lokiarchaeota archaeon]
MPLVLALLRFDPVQGMIVYANYKMAGQPDLTQDQVNSIFMSHASGKTPVGKLAIQLEGLSIASKFMERKTDKTSERLVLALVLNKGEKAETFFPELDALEDPVWEYLPKPQIKMNVLIQEAFTRLAQQVVGKLDAEIIRKRVIKRAQDLLDSNQIDYAQRLLAASRSVPDQLVTAANEAFRLRTEKRYDESTKAYNDAKNCALALQEPELADDFGKNAARSAEIPILEKSREKVVKAARDHMKKEEFLAAASKYKEAAELSDKLGDVIGKEINGKKSTILFQYNELESLG